MLVLEGLVGLHRPVQLQLIQCYWSGHRLGLPWCWMICLGNEQRSFCYFEIASKYCISDSCVDYDGYSISSKGFLPTVVDIMVIWVKFTSKLLLTCHCWAKCVAEKGEIREWQQLKSLYRGLILGNSELSLYEVWYRPKTATPSLFARVLGLKSLLFSFSQTWEIWDVCFPFWEKDQDNSWVPACSPLRFPETSWTLAGSMLASVSAAGAKRHGLWS